jgi:Pyruvate/2-oxoacid:ferredoxin oxidoreductase delta subunit
VVARAAQVTLLTLIVGGPGQLFRRHLARKKSAGKTIWLDDLTFGPKDTPDHRPPREQAADLSPNASIPSRVSRVMQRERYPEPVYPFAYRTPPLSGNRINGLGERTYRRARKVFHTVDYTSAWGGLEFYFHLADSFATFRKFMQAAWENRRRDGPVHPVQQPVPDPQAMSALVKAAAHEAGAALAGITELRDHHIYAGKTATYRYAISLAVTMDREAMLTVPSEEATLAVMDGYLHVGRVAIELAQRIRALGWRAQAATNLDADAADVLHVPIAIDAGLGQLGKHGSLITQAYGSNVRLATVLTDLPLAVDAAVDIGVDDFCATCRICVTNCPPHAIFETKQTVRGVERWYVNFDTCVPYFSEHGGCGICIEVCPWSEAGRGALMTEKLLARREVSGLRTDDCGLTTAD